MTAPSPKRPPAIVILGAGRAGASLFTALELVARESEELEFREQKSGALESVVQKSADLESTDLEPADQKSGDLESTAPESTDSAPPDSASTAPKTRVPKSPATRPTAPPQLSLWTRSPDTATAARREGFELLRGDLRDDPPTRAAIQNADVVILAVSDPAVGPLCQELLDAELLVPGQVIAHLAGALDLSPLQPAANHGVHTGSLHPMASLATRRSSLQGFAAAISASSPFAQTQLENLARSAGMRPFQALENRALHHAACCIVGNFPQVLLAAAMHLWTSSGLDADTAQAALSPLLLGAAENAARLGPVHGLTGPVARGDLSTLNTHLASLRTFADVDSLYREASLRALDLAAKAGTDPEELRKLREVLEDRKH